MTQEGSSENAARKPRSVYGVGEDPDIRFSLANERTALAWLRTGLGLVAGGVALTSLATLAELNTMIDLIAMVACLAGGIVAFYALYTWRRNERAMRLNQPLPAPVLLPVLTVAVVVMALFLAGFALAKLF